MLSRRTFLSLGAATLGAVVLAVPSAATPPPVHGKALGKWDLPSPTADGAVKGVLRNTKGKVLFELDGKLVATSASDGLIDGVLFKKKDPPNAPPVAFVEGKFKVNAPGGKGKFEADILVPDPVPTNPPKKIGHIKGVFKDFKPLGKPGAFKGHWAIK